MKFIDYLRGWTDQEIKNLFEYVGNGGKLVEPCGPWVSKEGLP